MSDPSLFRLRVTYGKLGRLAWLSHLEIARALERAVRRSGLPFAISQGFSPHMKIAFGAALPVGVGGTAEIYDLFLTGYVAPEKALKKLADASPEDLKPYAARYLEHTAKAASVAYPESLYECVLDGDASGFVFADTVSVDKKGKEKILCTGDFLVGEPCIEGNTVSFCLRSSNEGSLRADVLIAQSLERCPSGASGMQVVSMTRVGQRE